MRSVIFSPTQAMKRASSTDPRTNRAITSPRSASQVSRGSRGAIALQPPRGTVWTPTPVPRSAGGDEQRLRRAADAAGGVVQVGEALPGARGADGGDGVDAQPVAGRWAHQGDGEVDEIGRAAGRERV